MIDYLIEAKNIEENLVRWRRDFHRHPELRFEETRTANIVAEHLKTLGFEVSTGIGKTGVVGILKGISPGPVALMRFDMDALPIHEENEMEYKSVCPGVMHACGHDAHTAIGMGVAEILSWHKEELTGTVKLVFQPAEEGAGGAMAMIKDGVLENPSIDLSFGLHIHSQTPLGMVRIGDGPILTAADKFTIAIRGKGGHGAEPQKTIDVIIIAAQIINALQTIISRNVDQLKTAIISIGSIHAGSAFNIIPERAQLQGTIRTFDEDIRELVHTRMEQIIKGVAQSHGASTSLQIENIVPAAVNNPQMCAQVRKLAEPIFGAENITTDELATPSDDMAEFLLAAPGCHFILGASPGENSYPHHNARFDINEKALPLGVALLCAEAAYFLSD